MDGLKARLRESLRLRLSFALALAILAVAVSAGSLSFATAFDEAHELQDDLLRQIAVLYSRQPVSLVNLVTPSPKLENDADTDEESRVVVQILAADQDAVASPEVQASDVDAGKNLPVPTTLSDGLHTVALGGEDFRVLIRTLQDGRRLAVAQETGLRDAIARDGALRTVMPLLFLAPLLLFVAANLVRKMLRPVEILAQEVNRRSERDLHPIEPADLPAEIRPFLLAINQLLNRVSESVTMQRRFVADAAHELRSPMTALSLQAERVAEADMSPLARERFVALRRGIERGRNLLEQLLMLARTESSSRTTGSAPASVQRIYRRVLEDLMPLAQAKRIDIGMQAEPNTSIAVSEFDAFVVVKNLVDNAIRYTPEGGRVDLILDDDGSDAVLRIRDSGSGIPPQERSRVFDPFYRVLGSNEIGSGLGLSIVKTICARVGMDIQLAYADEDAQTGLEVSLRIKKAARVSSSRSTDLEVSK